MRSRTYAAAIRLVVVASLIVGTGLAPAIAADPASVQTRLRIMEQELPDPAGLFHWFNSPNPTATFEASVTVEGDQPPTSDGFAYTLDRTPGTLAEMPAPGLAMAYAPAEWKDEVFPLGTLARATLDMRGWLAQQTSTYSVPGMHDPAEGIWFLHARSVTATHPAPFGVPLEVAFGLDFTPPRAVANLQFVDKRGASIPYARRDVVWDNATFLGTPYDELSGDSRFSIYLNGERLKTTRLVRVARYMGASIEDLVPGKNVIGIACMDYAGNEGPVRQIVTYSDPDTPTISVKKPSAGQSIGHVAQFSVNASDKAGITSVRYQVDGVNVGSSTGAPYSLKKELTGFSAGSHTVTVYATDTMGRVAKSSSRFVLDPTAPRISSASVSPSTFFPFKKDGYKDYTTMKFNLSESARVTFEVLNKSRKVVYKTASSRAKGIIALRWGGEGLGEAAEGSSAVSGGTFYLRATAADAAGNVGRSAQYSATALAFEIVRPAPNIARVIPR